MTGARQVGLACRAAAATEVSELVRMTRCRYGELGAVRNLRGDPDGDGGGWRARARPLAMAVATGM